VPLRGPGSRTGAALVAILAVVVNIPVAHAVDAPTKKIVLIAGKKSHGPVGNGIHDYPWSVKLLKVMLDNSSVADQLRVEYHLDGWPEDDKTLDDADAIMVISDGRDGDAYEEAPHFRTEVHRRLIAQQIARGCGFLTFHFSTFAPDQFANDILSWSGGYFDWETDGKKQWYSAIKTLEADVQLGTPGHPVLRGMTPFKMREEFYYNIRFAPNDERLKPLLIVPAVEGRPELGNVVAWAKERPDGGRGFGTTCGHFYDNWRNANFRKLILNAIVWAAKGNVPETGVEARYYTHAEISAALAGKKGTERAVVNDDRPVKALILTGHQYPGHLWKDTTPAIKEALAADPKIAVDVSENIEDLATEKISGYDLLVLNYCNWEKPGLSDAAKAGFVNYLNAGGGLIIVHFANGAFHFSLPKAGDSDWPEYRKICRRVWDHTPNKSGHDAYGKFVVDIANGDHFITKGMEPFETIDELYFRQQGDEPIEVLLTAKSKVTGRDEPMAFVYEYGKGRVMQTVLGHAAESLRVPSVAQLLRRSALWVAQRDDTPAVSQRSRPSGKNNPFYHWSKDVVGFDWTEQDSVDNRWNETDVGPFLASIVPMPGQPPVAKGLSIKLGGEREAAVCYDMQTLALRTAWTGGFLKFDPARYGIINSPQMDGQLQFLSSPDSGWLAKSVKYAGLRRGASIALNAVVDNVSITETPGFLRTDDNLPILTRTIAVKDRHPLLRLRIGRFADVGPAQSIGEWQTVSWSQADRRLTAAVAKSQPVRWNVAGDDVQLVWPEGSPPQVYDVLFFLSPDWTAERIAALRPGSLNDLRQKDAARKGPGQSRPSDDVIITQGMRGTEAGPYQVDTLTLPFDNPYKALLFVTGHDFFGRGDLAICTVHGDVWTVQIDETLKPLELRWRRFASGLFQPLGLRIVDDVIYVLGRDRITRLHDDDHDGVADRYENFCDHYETSPGGHDYVTCLETDPEGNFYFLHAKTGVMKVSKDGSKIDVVATGLRNPNGMSVSPTGEITAAPQEGEWTPASGIFLVRPGDHFGYGGPKFAPQRPLGYDPPLCWIPRLMDNSSGGQCWTPDDSFGLPAGSLLHFSFGQCRTLLVLRESIDGLWQGGVIALPWRFESGLARGRFDRNGDLYVSGLKGWTTSAVRDGCLQRVRYVGGDVPWPVKMQTHQNGLALTFGCRLDKDAAENPENYSVQACNYRYAKTYGSPDLRPSHPTVEGRDDWDVASATLLDDGQTVFLEIPDLVPVMQIIVNWSIAADDEDKSPLTNTFAGTIHKLPDRVFAVPESSRRPRPGQLTHEEQAALAPGILFTYRQRDHVDAEPRRLLAGQFAAGHPPTSRLTSDPFDVVAKGYLKAPISGLYRFRYAGAVPATVRINDDVVGPKPTPVRLRKGFNRVTFSARSAASGSTNFQLLWESDAFAEEPVPSTVWFHDAGEEQAPLHRGRELFETFHCGRCHGTSTAPDFPAPSLKDLAKRMTDRWLVHWLLNPRAIRHDADMPALFDARNPADRQAAADVVAYLLTRGESASARRERMADANAGEVLYEELGCIACHQFTPPGESDSWRRTSLHFTADKFPGSSLTAYLQQPQRHFRLSRMPDFQLTDEESLTLTAFIVAKSQGRLAPAPELASADVMRGRKLFAERRCGHCHGPADDAAPEFQRLDVPRDAGLSRGCLANGPMTRGAAPSFPLDDEDRAALRAFLVATPGNLAPLTPVERAGYLTRRLNCTACHHRDHVVSPLGEIIAEESDRGVPAPALPNLTWAGDKFQAEWLRRLFSGEGPRKVRPWIAARMPAFPAYAEALAEGLAAEHGHPVEPEPSVELSASLVEIGRRLTLKDNGLDCRQCHAVAGQQPTGDNQTKIAPGVDFALTKRRLRHDFYRRFVLDPPRYDVTIRMPKLAIDGKSTQATGIFDGDAAKQFDALWHYIQSLPDPSP
jgi:type 1 glutamine amidotransferase/mono/diheme cytochrome c family protein